MAERGPLVFVFNFHPTNSYTDYRVGCKIAGPYKVCTAFKPPLELHAAAANHRNRGKCALVQIVLSSDEEVFGGWKNVSKEYDVDYCTDEGHYDGRPHSFLVYAPSRTVAVYAPSEYVDAFADRTETGVPGLGVNFG